jgi:hypothetical protein
MSYKFLISNLSSVNETFKLSTRSHCLKKKKKTGPMNRYIIKSLNMFSLKSWLTNLSIYHVFYYILTCSCPTKTRRLSFIDLKAKNSQSFFGGLKKL